MKEREGREGGEELLFKRIFLFQISSMKNKQLDEIDF